ncbi:ABC transporter ATP-binding protein [Candidatus Epulonipiscium fishelsonii]|uniref:ABC transporter ATP-binding protein n=1 Tax=Candidatus Epulonipiscium fishelsonii TaxID=77094 RepID=A0ACC8X853_9FIRM|nr:ABC transporter ATP-binding protein [Epulopiscium sp. SCG-B11WGA-EpuloA1]ONI40703.1 ABC transporter ATP-binding protein [Epulopiscium sp. SCG-B05WGA-EpuloA1]ONI47444.1 ABC transporter ATP-binding protein [Epulopiscium sp. SCG-C06WGA-EpuloA1]
MLDVKDINIYYGNIQALKDISFNVNQGEIVTLIGANGAGKTTTLQALSGMVPVKSGEIIFEGKSITNIEAHELVNLGIAHVPEGRRIFAKMTVAENLELGAYKVTDKNQIKEDIEKMFKSFPRLEERKTQMAGTMSGGEQQMLAIARALMSRPRVLLMDEPSMGLAPVLVQEIFRIIQDINSQGVTIVLVEQNANMALKIADRGYVLETGKIVLAGTGTELLNDSAVKEAYLGG